jgi:hypothetical protein
LNYFTPAIINPTESQDGENGYELRTASHTDQPVRLSTSNFSVSAQLAFVNPNYTDRHQDGTSPFALSSSNNDEQYDEIADGLETNSDLWY